MKTKLLLSAAAMVAMVTAGGTASAAVLTSGQVFPNPPDAGRLLVGFNSTGALTVNGGSMLTTSSGEMGAVRGGTGTATITGPGSKWTTTDNLFVGNAGLGFLTIENGGAASSQRGFVGSAPGSSGVVTVGGRNANWTVRQDIIAGSDGQAFMTVKNGGTVNASSFFLASRAGSLGQMTFGIGDDGSGAIAAGTVNVGGAFRIISGVALFDLTVDDGVVLDVGDMFTLIDYGSTFGGSFSIFNDDFSISTLADGDLFTTGIHTFEIDYDKLIGTNDRAFAVTVVSVEGSGSDVPGPAMPLLLAFGLTALAAARRRLAA